MPTPSQHPHLLFVIADDWSFGHAGAYGCPWVHMPNFDRVAREGLLFSRAYTPNAKCAPSRAAILTGRNPWQLAEASNHGGMFPLGFRTFPEALAAFGYSCGMTGKGWAPGVALRANGTPRELIGRLFDGRRTTAAGAGIFDNDCAANFSEFLDSVPAASPWFFWCGGNEPHRPYDSGSGVRLAGKRPEMIDRVPAIWPDTPTVRGDLLDYAFACERFDRHLGGLLQELDRRGLAESTMVIVTSDHGMPFPRAKGQAYEISNHLPLAVRWPQGIEKPGCVIDDFVCFTDFAPTLLEAAGINWGESGLASPVGRSLLPLFRAKKSGIVDPSRDHVVVGKERHDVGRPGDVGYPIRGLREGDWLYLRNHKPERWPAGNPETGYLNCDGSPTKTAVLQARRLPGMRWYWDRAFGPRPPTELYHVAQDPDCLENLAHVPEHEKRCADMHLRLCAILSAQDDPRIQGNGDRFDEYPPVMPGWADFYARWQRNEAAVPEWVNASDFELVDFSGQDLPVDHRI